MKAMLASKSAKPLSKIELIVKVSCLGKLPIIVSIPDGDIIDILSLIIIVAAFNIISGLTILVKNKTRDIAILKSIGVLNKSIIKIFFLVGVIIGTTATFFGIFLGVMFSLYIENLREFLSNTFNISLFPEEIYFLSTMPSEINPTSIFFISICSIFITIIVSIFPAIKASKLDPVKGLKYE